MIRTIRFSAQWTVLIFIGACLLALLILGRGAGAITAIPTPDPKPGSYGLEATKKQPPPTTGATITTPANGASFSTSPTTVNGICPTGLLVQVYDNNVMVGAVMCENGSFTLQVSLFAGINDLAVIVYDDLDQAGPTSSTVTVTYTDTNFTAFGQLVTLTSPYGRRSAAAGSQLTWPLQLSGGSGPYAFSIDWGDGGKPELKSQSLAGVVNIAHTYSKAGIYKVNITVTDANGVTAFLQLIAVASGQVDSSAAATKNDNSSNTNAKPVVLWVPAAISLVLLIPTYWLGRRSQLVSIRNKMLKERDNYEKTQAKTS